MIEEKFSVWLSFVKLISVVSVVFSVVGDLSVWFSVSYSHSCRKTTSMYVSASKPQSSNADAVISRQSSVKGTKWAVFGGKGIHSTWYWKGSILSAGIWTLDPWITDDTLPCLPLSYLNCWWMGIKVVYINSQIVCLKINQVCAIVTKLQIVMLVYAMIKCCSNSFLVWFSVSVYCIQRD